MEQNELTFWVCYKKDEAGKCNYLGDGEGHIRLFKEEQKVKDFLGFPDLTIEEIEKKGVYIHSIKGLFAVPEPEIKQEQIKLLIPSTPLPPSASEVLANWKKKRKRMA